MSALRKANGGVRGTVVGDTLRRLVARTIAQQIGDAVERATPFQCALKTRAGCECVSHMFQTLLDLDPRATILSVDGVGAFDLISRNAMMAGLSHLEKGDKLLPFVRLFHSSPSTFLWEDDVGTVHHIPQGEGGEQGDPLPLLFALGQYTALLEASDRLDEGERLVAFLNDLFDELESKAGEHATFLRRIPAIQDLVKASFRSELPPPPPEKRPILAPTPSPGP